MKPHIETAVRIMQNRPSAAEEELTENIAAEVGDRELVERLVEFVPTAFARVLLSRLFLMIQDCDN